MEKKILQELKDIKKINSIKTDFTETESKITITKDNINIQADKIEIDPTKIGANEYLEKNINWKPYDVDFDRVLKAIATVPKRLRKKEWEIVKIAIDDKFSNLR